jgi:PKHD-type hydroxylase
MLIQIPKILDAAQVAQFREKLAAAQWIDGRATAGPTAAQAKNNLQLDGADPLTRELGQTVLGAVAKSPLFSTGALPRRILPPQFNCYRVGQTFGAHIDNALRYDHATQPPTIARADLSATLFLSDPAEYDGGELVIQDTFGTQRVKLPAGDLLLYPSSSVHRVEPVTRGQRLASFFFIESLVRDEGERTLLFNLDVAIRRLDTEHSHQTSKLEFLGVYNNLLRRWAEL